jgi:predicted RNA-binding protein
VAHDETCSGVKSTSTREANSEVDRLRDVGDKVSLLDIVDEEAQCARRCIEVDLQHHRQPFIKAFVSCYPLVSVDDRPSTFAMESKEMREVKRRGNR